MSVWILDFICELVDTGRRAQSLDTDLTWMILICYRQVGTYYFDNFTTDWFVEFEENLESLKKHFNANSLPFWPAVEQN